MFAPASAVLRRRHLLCLTLAGAVTPRLARALTPEAAAPTASLYTALEALMRLGAATLFRDRYHQIAPVIDHTFELQIILRNSVGTHWATLDAGAQAALQAAFRRFNQGVHASGTAARHRHADTPQDPFGQAVSFEPLPGKSGVR